MHLKRTKIVCTIGPACQTLEQLTALTQAGMNVCRLNFSHGTHEDHAKLIKRIRQVRQTTGEPLAILQDLQGPKIRVGELPADGVMLVAGKSVTFTTGTAKSKDKIPVTYPKLHADAKPGQVILLDDGLLSVKVEKIQAKNVICRVINGGKLTSHKGMNLPETQTTISSLSDKDLDDVRFGVEQGVDWVALSFVRSADDIIALRRHIVALEKKHQPASSTPIRIIAKIEKPEAIKNLEAIIDAVDGVMVARGDLGVEIPAAQVPVWQKRIIHQCLQVGKPVIVATQMLDSMIRQPRATRAEISDIANAVIDHTDATMLSGETASGAYPLPAVETMAETIRVVEDSVFDDLFTSIAPTAKAEEAVTNIATVLAQATHAKAILVASLSGDAVRLVSRYRPELPILAAVTDERTLRQLNLSWGVRPFLLPKIKTVQELLASALNHAVKQRWLKPGEQVIIVAGEPVGKSGHANLVELRVVK